jgi:hypothetical protein
MQPGSITLLLQQLQDPWFYFTHPEWIPVRAPSDPLSDFIPITLEDRHMYERFTDRARKVMQLANQEAQRFNHEYIGTEHILLGLIKEGSGVASFVLKNFGLTIQEIRTECEKLIQPGPEMVTMGKLPQTPRAKKVIEYALMAAYDLGNHYVGTEHILLGLLQDTEGVAGQVLLSLGLKLDNVRKMILEVLGVGVDDSKADLGIEGVKAKMAEDLTHDVCQVALDGSARAASQDVKATQEENYKGEQPYNDKYEGFLQNLNALMADARRVKEMEQLLKRASTEMIKLNHQLRQQKVYIDQCNAVIAGMERVAAHPDLLQEVFVAVNRLTAQACEDQAKQIAELRQQLANTTEGRDAALQAAADEDTKCDKAAS